MEKDEKLRLGVLNVKQSGAEMTVLGSETE